MDSSAHVWKCERAGSTSLGRTHNALLTRLLAILEMHKLHSIQLNNAEGSNKDRKEGILLWVLSGHAPDVQKRVQALRKIHSAVGVIDSAAVHRQVPKRISAGSARRLRGLVGATDSVGPEKGRSADSATGEA